MDPEIAPLLKDMETMGVEIYSCGTCLTQYNLESKLKVGRRGTMNLVIEGMQDFEKGGLDLSWGCLARSPA